MSTDEDNVWEQANKIYVTAERLNKVEIIVSSGDPDEEYCDIELRIPNIDPMVPLPESCMAEIAYHHGRYEVILYAHQKDRLISLDDLERLIGQCQKAIRAEYDRVANQGNVPQ